LNFLRQPCLRPLALLCGGFTALAQTAPQPPAIPDTPAGHTLSAFLDAFNSGDHARLDAYVKTYDSSETVDDLAGFHAETGNFTLLSVIDSSPTFISFRIKQAADGKEVLGTFALSSTNPPKVKNWTVRVIHPGQTLDTAPLDAAARKRVIDAISARLTEFYIYPDMAKQMIAALNQHQQHGDYDRYTNGAEFAAALHDDLLAVSSDHHIFVDYNPFNPPPGAKPEDNKPHPPSPEDIARFRARLEHENCSYSKVEVLPRNIGYVKFNQFAPPDLCGATVVAALGFIAHTDAVIVDLRDNGGGDPAMVQFIASFFFDTSTHINDLYNRHDDETRQYWTQGYVPGPRISAPLFVLTSSHTFSGAEEFTYDMQTQKRATIVGETTGGGAHPVNGMPAGDHFTIGVPLARPINPITKKDWEGTGITPDVKVPAADALTTAQKLAAEKLTAK
jgi:hypothetical protein